MNEEITSEQVYRSLTFVLGKANVYIKDFRLRRTFFCLKLSYGGFEHFVVIGYKPKKAIMSGKLAFVLLENVINYNLNGYPGWKLLFGASKPIGKEEPIVSIKK